MTTNSHTNTNFGSEDRYLLFSLGIEEYAIPLLKVKEVIAVPTTTPIPYSPPYFSGIMNLRGQIISVVDLRLKLGLKVQGNSPENAVIIADLNGTHVGMIVDSVNSVLAIDPAQRSNPPVMDNSKAAKYLCGIVRREDKLTLLLDIENLLDAKDWSAIQKQKQAA